MISFNLSPVFHCGLEPLKGESQIDLNMNSVDMQCLDGIIDYFIKTHFLMFFYHFYCFLYSFYHYFLLMSVSKLYPQGWGQAKLS